MGKRASTNPSRAGDDATRRGAPGPSGEPSTTHRAERSIPPTITSTKNPRIVELRKLADRKHRLRQDRLSLDLYHFKTEKLIETVELVKVEG